MQNIIEESSMENIDDQVVEYRPQFEQVQQDAEKNQKMWSLMQSYIPRSIPEIQQQFAKHIEYTLCKTRFDFSKDHAYLAVSNSVRDRLIETFNDTQQHNTFKDVKRINYISLEFLIGRCLQNALVNIELESQYKQALNELGYSLEELYEQETDAALGNGGLGRLAACFLDSMATLNLPAWGYGLRYNYGIFKQLIQNGQQIEVPDYWLEKGYPWEIERSDIQYQIRFYGHTERVQRNGQEKVSWVGGECLLAKAYDNPIPGFDTSNTISLRLWRSVPMQEFDFKSFNQSNYYDAIQQRQRAEYITSVLYPKDDNYEGKELRLKQQYLLVSATIQDIIRRFKKRKNYDWNEFPQKNAIQLNDTHPTLGIVELMRILIDLEDLKADQAWDIVYNTFSYTNHTLLPEALEKWGVDLLGNLLPRHLEIIYFINHIFLERVRKTYPGDVRKLSVMSCIEENDGKRVRMGNLGVIGCHKVNGVAALHTELVKANLFNDFYQYYPDKFLNKTNGVTPRRWVRSANPPLAAFLTRLLGSHEWLVNMEELKKLEYITEDEKLKQEWRDIKLTAKKQLVRWVWENCGVKLNINSLFDIQVKRIHEYKRQLMNILQVIRRYLDIKASKNKESFLPKSYMYGGKAAPGYYQAKRIIKLINAVAEKVNNDSEIGDLMKVVFFPNYKVSNAEIIIPASDISNHISTAGLEASGTSNMKFVMNGGIICGTLDGANIEILEEVGDDNMFIFGEKVDKIDSCRAEMRNKSSSDYLQQPLLEVVNAIKDGLFGQDNDFQELLSGFINQNDFYLVGHDFYSYYETQNRIDETYRNKDKWTQMSMRNCIRSGKFSSDRTIHEYAEEIWDIKQQIIPTPASQKEQRFRSSSFKDIIPQN